MERTRLGRTDIEVSRLCIGCWQATGWASSDEQRFIASLRHALDLGINFLDTAPGYGEGKSEEMVGKAIQGRRDEAVISTKFWFDQSRPQDIRRSLEASLTRLGTDHVDLFQQHWPPTDVPLAETIGELERLKAEGKIRAVGVSNWMEPEWSELDDPSRVDCLQPCYNLLWRSIEPMVLPLCRKHGIGVIAYSPLCQGLLAGRFRDASQVPDDWRKMNRLLKPEFLPRTLGVVDTVERIARKMGKTAAQTALRWLLDQKGITAPIVGVSRPEQVDENLGALDWHLSEDDWKALDEVSAPLSRGLAPHETPWNWHPREAK